MLAKKLFEKLSSGVSLIWDEGGWLIGWIIGRVGAVVLCFFVGYVGINVVIGFLRWFFGVLF